MCENRVKDEVSIDFGSMILIFISREDDFVLIWEDYSCSKLHESVEEKDIEFVEESI